MNDQCAACRFWLAASEADGLCRRFPPVPIPVPPVSPESQGGLAHVFPRMMAVGWCGEFKRGAK